MKKRIFLTLLLVASSLFAETKYVEKTTKTYSTTEDKKPSGKILPTTELEILKSKGSKSLVKLKGWHKGKVQRILYYSKGERVISAAFSKKAKYEVKVLSTQKIGKDNWSSVIVTTWIDNSTLTKDLKALYEKANSLFQTNCGLCHAYHPTEEFTANQWPSIIKGMLPRTPMNKEQGWLVTLFAQKHAKK